MNTDFKIPESLKKALKNGEVVPFVGAGLSMSVKKKNADGTQSDESLFPSHRDFIKVLIQALQNEKDHEKAEFIRLGIETKNLTYLDALQKLQESLGKTIWYSCLQKSFDKSADEAHRDSLKLNKLVWELSNNLIITNNIDRVFQWTCPKISDLTIVNVQNVEYAQLQREKFHKYPTVWHLHGHINHKEEVIFTREQFEGFYRERNNEAKLKMLFNTLTQKTLLFMGFSLDDPYLHEQLQYIHDIYKGGSDSFYILFREKDIPVANFPDYVNPIPFSDFGKPLENLIEKLLKITKEDEIISYSVETKILSNDFIKSNDKNDGQKNSQLEPNTFSKTLKTKKSRTYKTTPKNSDLQSELPSNLKSESSSKIEIDKENWKAWGDHPFIVSILLTCTIFGTIIAFLQYCKDSPPSINSSKNESQNLTHNVNISIPENTEINNTDTDSNKTSLINFGLYVDRSQSADKAVLTNEEGKLKEVFTLLYPQNVNVLRFGDGERPIWGISTKNYKLTDEQYSKEKEYAAVIKNCYQDGKESNSCVSREKDYYSSRRTTLLNLRISETLRYVLDDSRQTAKCTNFYELQERIRKDENTYNIVITDGKNVCKSSSYSNKKNINYKIIVLLIPSVTDEMGESFENRKKFIESVFNLPNSKVLPLVTTSAKEIVNNLKSQQD